MEDWCRKRMYEVMASNEVRFNYCRDDCVATFAPSHFDVFLCCPTTMRVAVRPARSAHRSLYDRYVLMPSQTETDGLRADGLVREYEVTMSSIEGDDFHLMRPAKDTTVTNFVRDHPYCLSLV